MSLSTIFQGIAQGQGLVPRFGANAQRTGEYSRVLNAAQARRARMDVLLRGQSLAGMRLDGAPADRRDSIARDTAIAFEYAEAYDLMVGPGAGRAFLEQIKQAGKRGDGRLDSTAPMASQGLTYFVPQVYEIRHANLPCWNGEILDIAKDVDPAANEYVWYESDNVGVASVANTYDITSIKMVNGPIASDNKGLIVPALVGYETNFMDPRRENFAASMGKPDFQIEVMKRRMCEEALAQFANALWFSGDGSLGIDGLMNNEIVETLELAGGVWAGKTALQILEDLKQMVWSIPNRTQGSLGDLGKIKIILPPSQYQILIQPQTSAGSASIMEYFMDFFRKAGHGVPSIEMQYVLAASNSAAYNGGLPVLSRDTALIVYKVGDMWDPKFVLSQPIEVPSPVRTTGVGDVTYYHLRCGGMRLPDAQRLLYVAGL